MYCKRPTEVFASEIAEFLNLNLVGSDLIVTSPASTSNVSANTLICVDVLSTELLRRLETTGEVLVVLQDAPPVSPAGCAFIAAASPRLAFARVVRELFVEAQPHQLDPSATIAAGARLGRHVSVGCHSVIGPEVVIGDNTIVLNNVVITGPVTIGSNCVIKDNSTIGSEGYSFETDENGAPVHFPYLGRIVVGDGVWIGSNSAIERAELDDTVVADGAKIDDLVQIGQSCSIGARTMIAAGSVVSANAVIGCDCWIAPNVCVRDGIRVGDHALVGMGAVVVKDLEGETVYVGNPARRLRAR